MRRLVTIPGVWMAACVGTALFPPLLLAGLALDLARARVRLPSVRILCFLWCFAWIESIGIWALACVGLGGRGRRVERTFAVQRLYTAALFQSARALLSLKFEVDGDALVDAGPLLVLVNHASIVDTVLPGVFLAGKHGLKLRYVLKRELQWGPCLDIAGHWLPNHFASRAGGAEHAGEIAAVAALKTGLGPGEGVILYPEGTRFSEAKRARVLAKLDDGQRARAQTLKHLLPPRLGGSLALLSAAPACDVLLVGHHGLAGFSSIRDIWAGKLVGETVRLKFFRIPATEIPVDREGQIGFLYGAWQRIDDWLGSLG